MDVHITLALPIGRRKVKEFYGKKPKDAKYNKVLDAWRKDWNLQDGTPKLSLMPQYILSQTNAGESFKRNFVMYMVSCFFNGSKNLLSEDFGIEIRNAIDLSTVAAGHWKELTQDTANYHPCDTRQLVGLKMGIKLFMVKKLDSIALKISRLEL
ncbi:hypothetical protein Cgig2_024702 [Carnegiea gigantea]|uniref:Uncharacterized protein n=1 Tax=Carnegiea gigantea TaxID=171969 RepID=A0A9Q1GY03_9CARY|nr:hypothetical protein Cgig2_024702 [Carnegiea gigantea]